MSNARTNRSPQPKAAEPRPVHIPITEENDAIQAAFIDLVAARAWTETFVPVIQNRVAEIHDVAMRTTQAARRAYISWLETMLLRPEEMHAFFIGYALGQEDAIGLPGSWLERYDKAKEAANVAQSGAVKSNLVTPAPSPFDIGRRTDPIPRRTN